MTFLGRCEIVHHNIFILRHILNFVIVSEFLHLNKMVEFVYYPQKISWIAARRVCQSLGGDFAKIDSEEHLNELLRSARVNYGYDIL